MLYMSISMSIRCTGATLSLCRVVSLVPETVSFMGTP